MRNTLSIALFLGLLAQPLTGHHSVSVSNNPERLVTLQGSIAQIDWMNPHVAITLSARRTNGNIGVERVQIAAPNGLIRRGFDRNLIKVRDPVTIEAWPARDEPRFAGVGPSGRTLILSDGRRFDVSDQFGAR